MTPQQTLSSGDVRLHRWKLRFSQFRFHLDLSGGSCRTTLQRLHTFPAFLTCSFPLLLSHSGQCGDPEVIFFRTSLLCEKDLALGDMAHIIGVSHQVHFCVDTVFSPFWEMTG